MEFIIPWLILSAIVGIIGSYRKIGGVGAFFLSIILSPLIGLIITLISKSKSEEKYKNEVLKTQKQQKDALSSINDSVKKVSIADELLKLKKLLDEGMLTKDEFQTAKELLLDDSTSPIDKTNSKTEVVIEVNEPEELIVEPRDYKYVDMKHRYGRREKVTRKQWEKIRAKHGEDSYHVFEYIS